MKQNTGSYPDWTKVYESLFEYEVIFIKKLLEENGISVAILNKRDSVYGTFGTIELYTLREWALKAVHLIQKYQNNTYE